MSKKVELEDIVSLCKRRGFIFQGSEIYGGLAGFYDYGPLGVELANNIKQEWWLAMTTEHDNIFGLDGAIIQHPKLWQASGHTAGFTDPLVDCKNCGSRHRADHLAQTDSTDLAELAELLAGRACPVCGQKTLTKPRTYNMMMKTWVGPVEDNAAVAYLRPETAGPIFTNFENVRETMRAKLPFGIAQIGKAFRNEISPRDFIFRVRELEQMEMQYFINPKDQETAYQQWRDFAWDFVTRRMGISERNLSWHEHGPNERAHYAAAAHDVYFSFPFGDKELLGTHNRTDFDLTNHARVSGKDLSYFDKETKERFTPYVIESSMGLGRLFLAVLVDAYHEEAIDGETRVVLKLAPHLAPVRVAVSPLLKNKPELVKKARQIYDVLRPRFGSVLYDDHGNIGKRYRRQDEIGTPYCVTIDFETLADGTVTLRDRDTMRQTRLAASELTEALGEKLRAGGLPN
jgi:glycyl-tRNA synthetase